MVISRTPFRISFFGGGTDYPAWYRRHGGAVLSTTIDKYCYITCRYLPPFLEHKYRIAYSALEARQSIDEIAHPAVREVLRYVRMDRGVEIHHDADLPARSGMGSSSAFTVGLLHAVRALQGRMMSKHELATEGIHIEQDILRETVGSQDQVSAAYGGLNHIVFHPNDEISVHPMTLCHERMREVQSHLMLFYTGIKRTASVVASSYVEGIESKERQLRRLQDLLADGLSVLGGAGPIRRFGELLHEAWQAKRSLSAKVSNSEVDRLYARARRAGAVGGKVLGAGGGGFLLLFVPPRRRAAVQKALGRLIHVPFQFDFTGSQIIYWDPDRDYSDAERVRSGQSVRAFRELDARGGTRTAPARRTRRAAAPRRSR